MDWHIDSWGDCLVAHGICLGHPKLADGTYINTSVVVKAELDEGAYKLRFLTKTGNHYEAELGYIDIFPENLEKTRGSFGKMNIPKECLDGVEVLVRERKEKELKEADALTEEGDLLLKVSGNSVISAYFKQEGGKIHPLAAQCHVGMFQDSILLRKCGIVDYRYFPYPFGMETYHMSSTIKRLAVWNIGTCTAVLDKRGYPPGKVEKVEITKDYYQEGLFSPDMVDGKSLMAELLEGLGKENEDA